MDTRIDIINCCGDCSCCFYKGNDLHCKKTGKIVDEGSIPDWCPLEKVNVGVKWTIYPECSHVIKY